MASSPIASWQLVAVLQSISHVQLFVTPMDRSPSDFCLPEIVQIHVIESVMPSNHLVLCCPLLLPSIFPSIRVFSSELALCIRWLKYWSFSFNISPSNEHPGLISFRMDWFDLLARQRTLKSLLQQNSSKGSILWHSAFFMIQLSHPYMTTGKTIVLTIGTLYFMADRKRKGGSSDRFPLLGLWNHRRWWQQPQYKKMIACRQESYEKPRHYVKKERHHFADQGPYSQDYGLSSSHVWLWKVDHKEGRAPENWCFWTLVLEKTLESPLDSRQIKPDNLKGNQPWILIGWTDAQAPIFWSPDVNNWFIEKDPDVGEDWRQKKKKGTENEMVGWYHRCDGHELEQTPGDGEGQGDLACCNPWGCKESDMSRRLKNNNW